MVDLQLLKVAVASGQMEEACRMALAAVQAGVSPEELVNKWMVQAMNEVGALFERGEIFIPEMLGAARAMSAAAQALQDTLGVDSRGSACGRVVIGTVKGDLHDVGKSLVAMMLRGAGFEVIDLGVDVSPERFVLAIREHAPQVVGMSALLTTTMLQMPGVIQAIRAEGLRDRVRVMVGGAPVTRSFADSIAADGYAENAFLAVKLARRLVGA